VPNSEFALFGLLTWLTPDFPARTLHERRLPKGRNPLVAGRVAIRCVCPPG